MSDLSNADKLAAFKIATRSLVSCYLDEIAGGMTDDELVELLRKVLGIFGGSGGPKRISVSHQGSGLKIWASWGSQNTVIDKPIFSGQQTVSMAREVYEISDPTCDQLGLF